MATALLLALSVHFFLLRIAMEGFRQRCVT
jgi:hypothetical protein